MLTEQMASSGASDEQMASSGASEHALWNGLVPIVEVALARDKWWSMPAELSRQLYEKYVGQHDASYVWDWGEGGRGGSWAPAGEETKINRYSIDFVNFVQTNIDNNRKRSIRIVWVRLQDVQARFNGEKPSQA